jgi:hypothetical protein
VTAHAGHAAVGAHRDDQVDAAAVAVGGGGLEDQRGGLAGLAGAVHPAAVVEAELAGGAERGVVVEQQVVVAGGAAPRR